jgi:hypothetical protein
VELVSPNTLQKALINKSQGSASSQPKGKKAKGKKNLNKDLA